MLRSNGQIGRRVPRIPFSEPTTLLVGPAGSKTAHPCQVVDISELGIRVKTNVALSQGDMVDVLAKEPFPLRACVVWVGEVGSIDYRQVGLEFTIAVPVSLWGVTPIA